MPKPPKLTAFRFAVHVVALVLLTPCDAAASFETSYVMEPFEAVSNDTWYFGNRRHGDHDHDSVQLTEDAYVGSRALRLDVRGDGEDEDGLSTADVSVVQTFKPHVCFGAEEISLWYKASTPDARLELTLLDDSECVDLCDAPASLEHWTTPAPLELNQTEEWSERRIPFSDFVAEQVSGQRALDLRRLRGFRLEARSTSAATIQIDHLACIGGGDLFGAALFAAEDAAAPRPANRTAFRSRDRPGLPGRNGWDVEHFSDLSRDRSRAVLRNGTLALDYAVQQTEAWGGTSRTTTPRRDRPTTTSPPRSTCSSGTASRRPSRTPTGRTYASCWRTRATATPRASATTSSRNPYRNGTTAFTTFWEAQSRASVSL